MVQIKLWDNEITFILESEDKIDDKFKFFKIIENVSKYYKPI